MKKFLLSAAVAALVFAPRLEAQSGPVTTSVPADSVTLTVPPELQVALDQLAAQLTTLATRVKNDPQLRASALRVAQGAIVMTQTLLEQNTDVLQEALRRAADRLARIPVPQPTPDR